MLSPINDSENAVKEKTWGPRSHLKFRYRVEWESNTITHNANCNELVVWDPEIIGLLLEMRAGASTGSGAERVLKK